MLSTGNAPTTLQLDTSPTTLILGTNGAGKSTFLDAICYVLFKKTFRTIKKDQIVNAINGGQCEVECNFSIGATSYYVRRGIAPDFFDIYVNGEKRKTEASVKDPQKFLEEDVLKVDYDTFIQVVILGNAKYTPFMQLETPKRRAFIEHILDIGVFSTMNDLLGTKQKTLKQSMESLNKDIASHNEKISLVEGFIKKLELDRQKANEDNQAQIDAQNAVIDKYSPAIEQLQKIIGKKNDQLIEQTEVLNTETQAQIGMLVSAHQETIANLEAAAQDSSSYNNKLVAMAPVRAGIESNLKAAKAAHDFYSENDSCKVCKQAIHDDFKTNVLCEKEEAIQKFSEGLAKLDQQGTVLRAKIKEIRDNNEAIKVAVNKETSKHQAQVRTLMAESHAKVKEITTGLQTEIKDLNQKLQAVQTSVSTARTMIRKIQADMKAAANSGNVEDEQKNLLDIQTKLEALEVSKQESIELRHLYDVAAVLLKDTGIKAAIIKQYLPMINKLVNKYLVELDFYLLFALDENFKESFKSRHRDSLQYNSFSEGEKLRIDLALLFAWREIARMKNSCSTNLLILDEVIDGSMDNNGTDYFIKMINDLGKDSNVFVISHKQDSSLDKFQNVIRFQKVKNFSTLAEVV
jgi:DNA repair exonuclease SbcCD ATPase subunit